MIDLATLEGLKVPGSTSTPVSAPLWDALAQGRFMLQHCPDCERWVFYPRAICPHCWSSNLAWREASGQGRLATWSVQHRPGHPGWQPASPYALGLVRLAEGPTILSQILAPPDRLALDLPLRLRIVIIGENALPFFEAAP